MSDAAIEKKIEFLNSPDAVRERTSLLFEKMVSGEGHWNVDIKNLEAVADLVVKVIKDFYPQLDIPFHSRWGHFKVGDIDRCHNLWEGVDPLEKCRSQFELAVTSVLLDAGSGSKWSFSEEGHSFARSEGLAVASFHMFKDGLFSNDQSSPLRADGSALSKITLQNFNSSFQVSEGNPIDGAEGRTGLLNKLGEQCLNRPSLFVGNRIGGLVDSLVGDRREIAATEVLKIILKGLGPIWPSRLNWEGTDLGDIWSHPLLGDTGSFESFVAFHKLSQWLSYSLLEPLIELGIEVTGINDLTGLAEYRNGGLFIDGGVLALKDQSLGESRLAADHLAIIEWRAATVQLLDMTAELVRSKLNLSREDFPLVKILEGGTWRAGRVIAAEKRKGGGPPLNIISDGTVF